MYDKNDHKAFSDLFNDLFPQLCYYADSIVHDIEQAKDIVIESFVAVWRGEEPKNIKTLLYTVVRNKSFNYLRSHKNAMIRDREYLNRAEENTNIETAIMQGEVLKQLAAAVGQLPDKYKTLYQLIEKGFTVHQIALITKCTDDTVYQQKKRTIRLIKLKLMKYIILFLFVSCATTRRQEAINSVRIDTVYSGRIEYIIRTTITTDTIGKSYYRWRGSFPKPTQK